VEDMLIKKVKWKMKKKEVIMEDKENVDEVGGENDEEREKRKYI
jgi:hypothetical protein